MPDPITLGLVVVGVSSLLGGGVGGLALGRFLERRSGVSGELLANAARHTTEMSQLLEVRAQLLQEKDYFEKRVSIVHGWYEKQKAQSLEYLRMAESHEVKLPEIPKNTIQTGDLWKDRLFSDHPARNLVNLEKELKAAGVWGKEVNLRLEVLGSAMGGGGGFGKAISESWTRDGKKTKDIGPWVYHGTAKRALDDLTTFLRDDDTGLTKPNPQNKKVKEWADQDSPLVFRVSLEVTETIEPPPLPEVQIVEVAVVEYIREVVEVEKPVFVSIPEGQEANLMGYTPEEIRALVRDELALHNAEHEVEALGSVTKDPKLQARARAARAAQATKRTT